MFEKEAKKRARDFTDKEIKYRIKRLAKKFCRRNDVDRRFGSGEENLIVKAYLSAYLLCLHENKHKRTELEKENAKAKELLKKWQQADICDAVVLFADTEEFLKEKL